MNGLQSELREEFDSDKLKLGINPDEATTHEAEIVDNPIQACEMIEIL